MFRKTWLWVAALVLVVALGWMLTGTRSQGIEILNAQTESLLAEMRGEGHLVVRTVGSG